MFIVYNSQTVSTEFLNEQLEKYNAKFTIPLENVKTLRSTILFMKDSQQFILLLNNNSQIKNDTFDILKTSLAVHPTYRVIKKGLVEPPGFFMFYRFLRRYAKLKNLKNYYTQFSTLVDKFDGYHKYFDGHGLMFEENDNKIFSVNLHEVSYATSYHLDVIAYCVLGQNLHPEKEIYFTKPNFYRPHQKYEEIAQSSLKKYTNKMIFGVHLRSMCLFDIEQNINKYLNSFMDSINKTINDNSLNKDDIVFILAGDNKYNIEEFIKLLGSENIVYIDSNKSSDAYGDWWQIEDNKNDIFNTGMIDAMLLSKSDYLFGGEGNFMTYVKSICKSDMTFITPEVVKNVNIY